MDSRLEAILETIAIRLVQLPCCNEATVRGKVRIHKSWMLLRSFLCHAASQPSEVTCRCPELDVVSSPNSTTLLSIPPLHRVLAAHGSIGFSGISGCGRICSMLYYLPK